MIVFLTAIIFPLYIEEHAYIHHAPFCTENKGKDIL